VDRRIPQTQEIPHDAGPFAGDNSICRDELPIPAA
jgi:hypothetical protein